MLNVHLGGLCFVRTLCVEVHLPNWAVMSCQECRLGDWPAAGRPVPAGRMGQPCPRRRFSQLCRPEWAECGKWRWRGQTLLSCSGVLLLKLICEIYLACLKWSSVLIWFHPVCESRRKCCTEVSLTASSDINYIINSLPIVKRIGEQWPCTPCNYRLHCLYCFLLWESSSS